MIHKITQTVNYNWWLKRLDTELNEPTNQNLLEVHKVGEQTNKKTRNKQPNVPFFPGKKGKVIGGGGWRRKGTEKKSAMMRILELTVKTEKQDNYVQG